MVPGVLAAADDALAVGGPEAAVTIEEKVAVVDSEKPTVMNSEKTTVETIEDTASAMDVATITETDTTTTEMNSITTADAELAASGDWSPGSVEPGEPCPECRGLLWWETLEGGRHCLDCERAELERNRELARLAQRLRAAGSLPPWGAEAEAEPLPSGGLQCDRCKRVQFVEATTHGGRTVRLDCAKCGRFVAWKVWYGKLLVENGN